MPHGLFVHQGITTIVKSNPRFADLATKEKREEAVERASAAWILKTLELHEARLSELKARVDEEIKRLERVAGVGPLVALTFVAYVGDVRRFENASQVSNYLGVCCASHVKPQKIADQAIFYPANSESSPDNRDFCVISGAKIHKCNRLLG
jgi:hypothetical protein